jgi:hypothetical protein
VVDSCEHGNEPSVSIKGGEFIDWLSDYWLLEKGFCSIESVVARVPSKKNGNFY